MARGQGPAGRGNPEAGCLSALQVVVHDLAQAQAVRDAAAACGLAVELRSAPDAAHYAGIGYLQALGDAAGVELVIDCGDDPGLVMAGLRVGCRKLAFAGDPTLAARLAEMAAASGAVFAYEPQPPRMLRLAPGEDGAGALRQLVAAQGG